MIISQYLSVFERPRVQILGPETGKFNDFRGFTHSLQANDGILN
jgi:hypothetical protein